MDFLDLVKTRYSVRSYEQKEIESSKLDYIMECVRLAPSAVNFQPWTFAIITEPERLAALKTAYSREWIQTAPCIIVACADHTQSWHRKVDNKDHADVDLSIAIEHLCLAAAEQGLGTCWVCNFDVDTCRKVMQLPSHIEPIALIPIGYPSEQAIPEKKRKTLEEIML